MSPPSLPKPKGSVTSAQLRAFHAVATTGGFTQAAEVLGVSQPAVSMQVHALEEAHGVELLIRGRKGVVLTGVGEKLLQITGRLASLEGEAEEVLGAAGALLGGNLRVGADEPFGAVALLASFRARYPEVSLSLTLGNSNDVLKDLLEGRTDVATFSDRIKDPRLVAVAFAKSHQVLIVPKNHALAAKKAVRLKDLAGQPMLLREHGSMTRKAFEEALKKKGVVINVVLEVGSREALQEAVVAGLGVGVIIERERARDDRMVAVPFEDVVLEHVTYVACLEERRRRHVVAAFMELVPRLPKGKLKKA